MANGTGISGFARSKVQINNNLCLDNNFTGIDMRDSCNFSIRSNILQGNSKGLILFKEGSTNNNRLFRNTFWENTINIENFDKTANPIVADPLFTDPANGDFSLKPGPALEHKQGLTNPEVFKTLWRKWKNRAVVQPSRTESHAKVVRASGASASAAGKQLELSYDDGSDESKKSIAGSGPFGA